VPSDEGYSAVGWLVFTVGFNDYYVPAWE
jgi:hypothetical protein